MGIYDFVLLQGVRSTYVSVSLVVAKRNEVTMNYSSIMSAVTLYDFNFSFYPIVVSSSFFSIVQGISVDNVEHSC